MVWLLQSIFSHANNKVNAIYYENSLRQDKQLQLQIPNLSSVEGILKSVYLALLKFPFYG